MEIHTYSSGQEVEIVRYDVCPTCDYGLAPLTPNGNCLNCYAIIAHAVQK